jgi:hypothetical protein
LKVFSLTSHSFSFPLLVFFSSLKLWHRSLSSANCPGLCNLSRCPYKRLFSSVTEGAANSMPAVHDRQFIKIIYFFSIPISREEEIDTFLAI